MDQASDTAKIVFEQKYGRSPSGLWSAPGRVNLIGEHTDYNDGFVLPFAIEKRTYVTAAPRDDQTINISTSFANSPVSAELSHLDPATMFGWSSYPLGVMWAMGQNGASLEILPGVDIHIESDVPYGSGLSSSAALECAVAIALNDLWKTNFDLSTLAHIGQLAENKAAHANTGIMDQTASLFGEKGAAIFLDCRTLETEPVVLGFDQAQFEVLVIDTKVKHAHSTGGYDSRREACEKAAAIMGVPKLRDITQRDIPTMRIRLDEVTFKRARHVITENERVLHAIEALKGGFITDVGPLLTASHKSMRDDFEISTPEINAAVDTANANGALGARLTGGGFGGSAIALIPTAAREHIQGCIVSTFEMYGFARPDFYVVHPSQGAHRDRTFGQQFRPSPLDGR